MDTTTRTSRFRAASLFAFAVAGLVFGHALAYALAVPAPATRRSGRRPVTI